MKKIMSVLLTVCILLTACVTAFAVDEEITDMGTRIGDSDVFWKIDIIKNPENEEEIISTVLKFSGEGSIPDYDNDYDLGKPVYPWKNLTYDSVEFGEKIVGIGNGAFAYSKELKNIVVPETVTVVGNNVFYGCPKLETAEIKSQISSISPYIYAGCDKLKSVVLPDSTEVIGHHSFYNCSALEDIAIPEKTGSIGEYAFAKCTSLKSIILSATGKIGKYAFYSCEALETLDLGKELQQIDSNAFDGCVSLTAVAFPEGTLSIAGSAFSSCSKLSSVTLPETLKTVGDKAFNICPELKAVTIGKAVETIGEKSFGYGKRGVKVEGFTISGYNDTVADQYAKTNEFIFVSLDIPTPPPTEEFPELVIDAALKTIIDSENKLIYFYQMNAEKSVLEECINKDDFDGVTVSADVISTGTTLTLTAGEETQVYTFLVPGDVTGDSVVNSADALAILQHSVESQPLEGNALIVGNLNGDTAINSADALMVLQVSVGQIELDSLMPTK